MQQTVPGVKLTPLNLVLWFGSLGIGWATLIRQLALEWEVNPQYAYGWAVPALCILLLIRDTWAEAAQPPFTRQAEKLTFKTGVLLMAVLFAYGVTRLIQEANQDWRLVSWLMAIEVVGLTWLVWPMITCWALPVFPLLFILVAVPWPTLIEAPFIRCLTAVIASGATEILGLICIPALRHGNVIEVSSSVVGIEEACSGIRSLQATFMLTLFFGHWYRLSPGRRLVCVGAGFGLAFGCNLLRTTLLAMLAAKRGVDAVATWHDAASVCILVGCFGGTWLVARCFHNKMDEQLRESPTGCGKQLCMAALSIWTKRVDACKPLTQEFRSSPVLAFGLASLLGLIEFGTSAWYRVHEAGLPGPVTWHIAPPTQLPGFHSLKMAPVTRRILRVDEATNVSWVDENNFRWQALFLHWKPGGAAARLARNHTPADCLPAAGKEVLEQSALRLVSVKGLDLPFRTYRARDENGAVRVFYCLWEDRSWCRTFDAAWLSYRQRLAAVLKGQRNSGQRSLELAVWGTATQQEAEAALEPVLGQLIVVGD